MTVYYTRLVSVSPETEEALQYAIPSFARQMGDSWTFEHDSDNEQEVAHWFRGVMLSASDGGATWITPVSLEKEQQWLTGQTLIEFNAIRIQHEMEVGKE